jgi:hypothetical protein
MVKPLLRRHEDNPAAETDGTRLKIRQDTVAIVVRLRAGLVPD